MYYKYNENVFILIYCSDDSSVCIHSDDEIAPVAYLQLKQLSLVEKTERVAFNHSSFDTEKLTNKSSVNGMYSSEDNDN